MWCISIWELDNLYWIYFNICGYIVPFPYVQICTFLIISQFCMNFLFDGQLRLSFWHKKLYLLSETWRHHCTSWRSLVCVDCFPCAGWHLIFFVLEYKQQWYSCISIYLCFWKYWKMNFGQSHTFCLIQHVSQVNTPDICSKIVSDIKKQQEIYKTETFSYQLHNLPLCWRGNYSFDDMLKYFYLNLLWVSLVYLYYPPR